MKAGRLNRRVTILERTETRHPTYGTKEFVWQPAFSAHAEVADILPSRSDRLAEGMVIERRPARVRMRFRSDITQNHRIEIDGRQMRIVAGPAEIGRRDGIELMVEELSTEGERP